MKMEGQRPAGALSMRAIWPGPGSLTAESMPPVTLLDNIPWMQRRTMLPGGLRNGLSAVILRCPERCQRSGESITLLSLSRQIPRQDGRKIIKSALSASRMVRCAAAR